VDIAKRNPFNFLCGSGWFARIEKRGVGEEFVGSYLYQVHLYRSIESNDYGRLLSGNNAYIKVKRNFCAAQVVASAINDKGEQLFPRNWNEEFIDAPLVKHQKQPSTDKKGMESILKEAAGRYRVLYALLAGCGPLRAGEALGLEIGKHICEDCRTLYIRQKAKRGDIQPFLKTQNGERDVDLCTSLAAMLKEFIGTRTAGLLFRTSSGRQILQTDILRDSLHPILKKLEHVKGGFNVFRRFRITELKKSDCPDALQHFWSGHAHTHVSERYTKLLQDRDFRLEWAEKIGMGFELPARSVAPRAPLMVFRKAG
jgi:integrase